MGLKAFILGFFAKTVASLDDTVTKVPVVAAVAKRRLCKFAFAFGNLLALLVSLGVAGLLGSLISGFAYTKYILALIIVLLAIAVRFDILVVREKKLDTAFLKWKRPNTTKLIRLVGIGFVVSLVTLVDDTLAYLPLLSGHGTDGWYAAGGILLSTIAQLFILIYFAEALQKFKYAKQLSFYGLLAFAVLILTGVV